MNKLNKNIAEKMMPSEKEKASNKESLVESWTSHEKENCKSLYGCEIIQEKCTIEETKNTNIPRDTYILTYKINDQLFYDLVRGGKRVSVFDMYYDKFGSGAIQSIEWGYGKINPRLWGYTPTEKKKRK